MICSFKKAYVPKGKQTNIFTFCGFAMGWFHHVWLIDRVRMMKIAKVSKGRRANMCILRRFAVLQFFQKQAVCAAD